MILMGRRNGTEMITNGTGAITMINGLRVCLIGWMDSRFQNMEGNLEGQDMLGQLQLPILQVMELQGGGDGDGDGYLRGVQEGVFVGFTQLLPLL